MLPDSKNTSVKTMQMQAFFMSHTIEAQRIVHLQRALLKSRTSALTNEILTCELISKDDRDKLFKKIVVDIIVNNSLGSPSNGKVLRLILFMVYKYR